MNIGIFTDTYYPEVNGVANSAYQLKNELEKRGNTVYVFTVSNPEVKEKEYHVFRLRSVAFVLLKERRISYPLTKIWINKVKKLDLDVIHTQTEFCLGHIGRKIAKCLNIPLVHTYHTIYEDYTHYLRIHGNQKLKSVVRILSRKFCDKADLVIAPTEKVKKLLFSYGVKRDIVIQPTGVNLLKFERYDKGEILRLKKKYHLNNSDHVLLYVGRISREKNLMEIIEIISQLKELDSQVKLLIVGNGPELELLRNKSKKEGIENHVIFVGAVSWEEIENYYALGDVFVCASNSETQGLTYIEALASGKPILVRKDECLEGILQNGLNGYGYNSNNDFIKYYQELFMNMKCRKMRETCINSVNKLSMQAFGQTVERVYQNACDIHVFRKRELYEKMHQLSG